VTTNVGNGARTIAVTPPDLSKVRVIAPAPRTVWAEVMAADPDAIVTQSSDWLDCLCRTGGYVDGSRLYEFPHGRRLVLPLAARIWAGARIAEESWPYGWGYGGVLAAGGGLTTEEAAVVLSDLAQRPAIRTGVMPMPLISGVWQAAAPSGVRRVPYLTQILNLEGGFETVWSRRYRPEARRHVRRAGRMSLDLYRDRPHGTEAFARLYRESVDRWARQRGQPLWLARGLARRRDQVGRVAAVAAALGDACTIWSAYRAGEPVAACVVLQHGRHAMGWMSANCRALAQETSATYLLSSLAIEAACAVEARYFHMGESDPGSGVERHKAQFGATPVRYHALRLERLPVTEGQRRLYVAAGKAIAYRKRGR
jgi:hypothetical protein